MYFLAIAFSYSKCLAAATCLVHPAFGSLTGNGVDRAAVRGGIVRQGHQLSQQADERRADRRYRVSGVRGQFLFSTDARVIDMSLNGMSIETGNPLKVGREYTLSLDRDGEPITLSGKVVWCTLVRTTRDERGDVLPVYRAGVHFEDVITGKAGRLLDFIHQNAVVSLEKRLFGRFRVETDQSADLGFEADFRVRQISISGMLVETDIAPPVDTRCRMEISFRSLSFKTDARVVRVQTIEREAPLFSLGVQFLGLAPESRLALEEFIQAELD